MNTIYATLVEIKNRIDIETSDDDSRLLEACEEASRALDAATGRKFFPRLATHYFDYQEPYELRLDEDLLSITTFTTDNDGTTLASSDYFAKQGDSYNFTPYDRIVLDESSSTQLTYGDTPRKSQKVGGVWGYDEDYANAHTASGATLDGALNASAETVPVSDGDKFETGQTIRIGSEWLHIEAISGDNLTVTRGLNGSTAATHDSGAAIDIYRPMREVRRVAVRFALWLYKQDEAPFTYEISTDGAGRMMIPKDAPPEVHRFVKRYRRMF